MMRAQTKLVVLRFITAAIGFLGVLYSLRVLGAEVYGRWSVAAVLSILAGSTCFGWLSQAIIRFGLSSSVRRTIKRKVALSSCVAAATLAGAGIGAAVLEGPTRAALVGPALVALGAGLTTLAISVHQTQQQLLRAAVSELTRVLSIGWVFPSVAAITDSPSIGLVAAGALLTAFASAALRSNIAGSEVGRARQRGSEIFRYGAPLSAWMLLAGLYQSSDRYIVLKVLTERDAGEYAAIYDFSTRPLNLALGTIHFIFQAAYFRARRSDDSGTAEHNSRTSIVSSTIAWLVFAIPTIVILQFADLSRFDIENSPSIVMTSSLAISTLIWAISLVLQRPLQIENRTTLLLGLVSVSVILNVALNLLLVPRYGRDTAAVTTLVSSCVYLSTVALASRKSLENASVAVL